ncbi:hypothetical protein [Clostridium tyrobutyricum]|uniref:hypothetical protein n=1 Tax=Clostridium tyrobutyricum TaxID=1519 RepID=UPI0011CC1296|nr:hypothetical protein [Clostridium tyrobutyricum]
MASNASQKINATKNREKEAGKRYTEIRDIINKNSDFPFKKIIQQIAGVTAGSFYNYTSPKSAKYGCVSLFTAENMSSYFNLPLGIFDCTVPFDEKSKEIIAQKIRSNFKNTSNNFVKISISDDLKKLALRISNENDIDELNEVNYIIDDMKDIVQSRINTLNTLKKISK